MPKMPTATAPTGPTPAQQAQTQAQQESVASQQLPNLQELGGGSFSPAYSAMEAALLAGTAGQPGGQNAANRAVANAFGFPSGFPPLPSLTPATATSNTGVPPSPTALSDFVNAYFRT
jgi:hypothetical protein